MMSPDSRYDVLFEPIAIGPVTAPNRFYQVPHCSGMGYERPRTLNRMREVNAEGGWGVVCTEFCSIHPSALSNKQCTLWDDDDVAMLADMVERVHRHGALAGVQLWYGGYSNHNALTREIPLAPHSMPVWHGPGQSQAMDKSDIRQLRTWHREAAVRAKRAGFDIVYVYAAHGYLPAQFLSPVQNQRTDEYGGSFENRARLIRELLEDTKDAIGDTCGVALRFAVDNLDAEYGISRDGEGRDLVEYLAEWARVRDYRVTQLRELANVDIYPDSRLDAEQILEFGFQHVGIATGSHWRRDGLGRSAFRPIPGWERDSTVSVEGLMNGAIVTSPCVVYDDDHHYMGSVVAEELRGRGHEVTLITSANELSPESFGGLEQQRAQAQCLTLGIDLVTGHAVTAIDDDGVELRCKFTGRLRHMACRTFLPVTSREPDDSVYHALMRDPQRLRDAGILSVTRFGDCAAPGLIAAATFAGHRYARELGANVAAVERDRVVIALGPEH